MQLNKLKHQSVRYTVRYTVTTVIVC